MGRTETTRFLGELLVDTRLAMIGKHWARVEYLNEWNRKHKK